jgi:drug/metabolite transporter (DMT)-like permease
MATTFRANPINRGVFAMSSPTRAIYVVAALSATLCWGAGMTLTKLALASFEPSLLLVIQLLSSIAFLVLMAPILRIRVPTLQSLSKIWWLGVLEPGLAYFLGLEGLQRISAAEAVVLSSTESIFIVLLAWWWAKERPHGAVLVLAAIGALGTVLVAGTHMNVRGLTPSTVGDALLIGGVLCAAGYVVLSSRLSSVTEPLSALIAQQIGAVVFAVGMYVIFNERALVIRHVTSYGWVLAATSGIVQYACAFWLYLWALKGLTASVAGLYLNLIPVFGLLIAIPALGDRLSAMQWVGGSLVIGSVMLLTLLKEQRHGIAVDVVQDAPVTAL